MSSDSPFVRRSATRLAARAPRAPRRRSLHAVRVAGLVAGIVAGLLATRPARADEGEAATPENPLAAAYEAARSGDLDRALDLTEPVAATDDASAYALTVRGWVLSKAGRKEEAEAAYRRALALQPDDPVVMNNLGAVLLDLGRADEAESQFRRALAIRPGYADAENNLGAALERRGRTEEAERAYRRATAADPGSATALNNLGALALKQGKDDEARRALAKAHDLDPKLGAPVLNLLLLGGQDLKAGEAFERLQAAANEPGAPASVRARAFAALAGRAASGRRFEEALDLYGRALALAPDDAALLNNMAVVEDQLGMEREAMLHLDSAMRANPQSLVSRNNIGIVQVHRGNLDLAEDTFRQILAGDPDFHRAHYNLGVVLAAAGRQREALQSFERAAKLAPKDAEVRYDLGLLRRSLGGSQASEKAAYEEALALDPDLAEAHLSLGCLLADPQTETSLRDEAEARRHLVRFLELSLPSDGAGRQEAESWLHWLEGRADASDGGPRGLESPRR